MRQRYRHLSAFSYCLPTRNCMSPRVVPPPHVYSYLVGSLATQSWSSQSQLPPTHFTTLSDFLGGDCPLMLSVRTAGREIDGWTLNKAWTALNQTDDSSLFTCHNIAWLDTSFFAVFELWVGTVCCPGKTTCHEMKTSFKSQQNSVSYSLHLSTFFWRFYWILKMLNIPLCSDSESCCHEKNDST